MKAGVMLQRKWLDYPRPGTRYPGTEGNNATAASCRQLAEQFAAKLPKDTDIVAGIDTGSAIAGATAMLGNTGFVVIRKIDTLATELLRNLGIAYHMGEGIVLPRGLEIKGKNIVLIDEVMVSGNTAVAVAKLLTGLGASVTCALFTFEIDKQGGRQKLEAIGIKTIALATLPAPADPSRLDEALAYTAPYRHHR
jgi:adenine phosphoribosyltransferase